MMPLPGDMADSVKSFVAFFPAQSLTTSMIEAFGAFGAGFLTRPLGALLFGWIGDHHGRERALTLSIFDGISDVPDRSAARLRHDRPARADYPCALENAARIVGGRRVYDLDCLPGRTLRSALAKSMAERRCRVIVLEREKEFRDRVRGEQMACWGVAEARKLGIYEHLVNGACGQEVRWWETRVGSTILGRRDFLKTTPQQMPQFMFYHPRMQEILASAAKEVGVEYRRGVTVSGLESGGPATLLFENGGATERVSARLVVGADGRGSLMRKWGGFVVRHDPPRRLIAGVLFDRMFGGPSDARTAGQCAGACISRVSPRCASSAAGNC
jgi:hypothetical protein